MCYRSSSHISHSQFLLVTSFLSIRSRPGRRPPTRPSLRRTRFPLSRVVHCTGLRHIMQSHRPLFVGRFPTLVYASFSSLPRRAVHALSLSGVQHARSWSDSALLQARFSFLFFLNAAGHFCCFARLLLYLCALGISVFVSVACATVRTLKCIRKP